MFDVFGSYMEANLLGACLPFGGFVILVAFCFFYYRGEDSNAAVVIDEVATESGLSVL